MGTTAAAAAATESEHAPQSGRYGCPCWPLGGPGVFLAKHRAVPRRPISLPD